MTGSAATGSDGAGGVTGAPMTGSAATGSDGAGGVTGPPVSVSLSSTLSSLTTFIGPSDGGPNSIDGQSQSGQGSANGGNLEEDALGSTSLPLSATDTSGGQFVTLPTVLPPSSSEVTDPVAQIPTTVQQLVTGSDVTQYITNPPTTVDADSTDVTILTDGQTDADDVTDRQTDAAGISVAETTDVADVTIGATTPPADVTAERPATSRDITDDVTSGMSTGPDSGGQTVHFTTSSPSFQSNVTGPLTTDHVVILPTTTFPMSVSIYHQTLPSCPISA